MSTSSGVSQFDYQVTGRRIVAALIDLILLGILFLVMAATLGDFGSTDGTGFSASLGGGPAILYAFLVLAYYIILEGVIAATLGKVAMGLKVVKAKGEPYRWGSVLLRNILRPIDALPLLYLVGLISIAVTPKKQRLGDLAAHTLVVRPRMKVTEEIHFH